MRSHEFTQPSAAGCIVVAEDTGRWCLQQRSNTVSDPGVWSTWGGGAQPGETLTQTVLRELAEESGYTGPVTLRLVDSNPGYATFMAIVPHEFEPRINSESQDWCWCEPDQLPEPLHPGLAQLVSKNINEDIHDILQPLNCGPFDGGCVLVAQALQQIHGGRVVVLTDADDRAQHAAVLADGQLIDYDGAADPNQFVRRFEQNERVRIQGIRAIRDTDLPDAPRNADLIPQIVQALSENFADGKKKGKSRPGRVKRAGASCNGSVTDLRARAKKASGERAKMLHWCANMKSGNKKKKK